MVTNDSSLNVVHPNDGSHFSLEQLYLFSSSSEENIQFLDCKDCKRYLVKIKEFSAKYPNKACLPAFAEGITPPLICYYPSAEDEGIIKEKWRHFIRTSDFTAIATEDDAALMLYITSSQFSQNIHYFMAIIGREGEIVREDVILLQEDDNRYAFREYIPGLDKIIEGVGANCRTIMMVFAYTA